MATEYQLDLGWLGDRYNFMTLIDIGANDGAYGAHLQSLFDIGAVHAFEPLPEHQETLTDRGFVVYGCALSDEPLQYVHGHDRLLPPLADRLVGLEKGDSVELELAADEGFGRYEPGHPLDGKAVLIRATILDVVKN